MNYVVVGFILKKDKILLVKHKDTGLWLPVGGHKEKGESFHQTLKREILEETNLNVEINEKPIFILKESKEITPHYLCRYKSGKIKLNKDELEEFIWLKRNKMNEIDLHPTIKKLCIKIFKKSI